MSVLVNNIISTFLQVISFTLIPFIFFLFRKDKSNTFSNYIGLYKSSWKSILYVLFTSVLFLLAATGSVFIDDGIKEAVLSPNSITGKLRLMGLSSTTILVLLIIAFLKTSLSEEILFRGFIARQLINKMGFSTGNILQAILFGGIHLLLFWLLTKTALTPLIFIFLFSSSAGWTIGYIKEKYANGSIIPGWIAHALGNSFSYYLIAFVL